MDKEPVAPIPVGDELRRVGTANQTKISGTPVQGPLFDFAPVINQFLQALLFGDIFARDIGNYVVPHVCRDKPHAE